MAEHLTYIFVVILFVIWSGAECLTHIPLGDGSVTENVNIDLLAESTDHEGLEGRTNHMFPDKMSVRITQGGKQINLNLTRNSMMKQDIPITVERNGRIAYQLVEQKEMISFYQDKNSSASFIVTKMSPTSDTNQHGGYRFVGTLHSVNETVIIQPSAKDSNNYNLTSLPVDHLKFDYIKRGVSNLHRNVTKGGRSRRSYIKPYEVEVLAVLDYSVYQFWYHHSAENSILEKDKDAKNNIRHYYALIMNDVDLRYQTIDDRDYRIRVLLTGVHIADRKTASPWTEKNRLQANDDDIDALQTITDFRAWWKIQSTVITKHDHAMLFTRMNITVAKKEPEDSHEIVGYAYMESACTNKRQSLIEDDYEGYTPVTAAHELGHNLGAQHDDLEENKCHGYDGYIMAATQTSNKQPVYFIQRQWLFSECSKDYFQQYISTLNKKGTNCLSTRIEDNIIDRYEHDLPGQIYGPDIQCQNAVGEGSFFLRYINDNDFSEICTKMPCAIPERYGYHYKIMPMEGTTCGPGKVCKLGHCKESGYTLVPTNGECLYGDSPGKLAADKGTCEEEVEPQKYANRCYYNFYKEKCCRTCQRHAERLSQTNNDCKYGDHAYGCDKNLCQQYLLVGKHMYDCCHTCNTPHQTTTTTTATTTRPPIVMPVVGSCIHTCEGIVDGDYQSCRGCNVYASCVTQTLYDERPCPGGTVWTDDLRRCDYQSNTCYSKQTSLPAMTTRRNGLPPLPTSNVPLVWPSVGTCIRSCVGIGNGDYQSCADCDIYITCSGGLMYDQRPCPGGLVWTDDLKRCELSSNTC